MNDSFKEFYKKYPDLFIEEFLGVRLNGFQKIYLRAMNIVSKEENDMEMKYKIGDIVYFENGDEAKILSMAFLDEWVYNVASRNNMGVRIYSIEKFDKTTHSEQEWKEKQERESWKFKVGDKISNNKTAETYIVQSQLDNGAEHKYGVRYGLVSCNGLNKGCEFTVPKEYVEMDCCLFDSKPKQYIPSKNEQYFFVDLADENLFGIATWLNDQTDYHNLKLGLIKETPQECVKLAKEMLKKLDLEV